MSEESILFTYVAPFVGVVLVAIGIGGAVPGGYAIIQDELTACDQPTIAVEGPEETAERFGERTPNLTTIQYDTLVPSEQRAFVNASEDPVSEAKVTGPFPNGDTLRGGALVVYEGERYYVTVVAENPCYNTPQLQFPLGVFAIIFGVIGILSPPIYRKLVELEERANVE